MRLEAMPVDSGRLVLMLPRKIQRGPRKARIHGRILRFAPSGGPRQTQPCRTREPAGAVAHNSTGVRVRH